MKRLGVVALVALTVPSSALAHASLRDSSPEFRQRLAVSPREVVLSFDQPVSPMPRSIQVRTAKGGLVSGSARTTDRGHRLRVPVRQLARGAYTVRWQALSGDGHVVSGVFTFGVRVDAPPPTEAFGAKGPTRAEDLVRWAYFLALALLLGGLGFRLLVLRGPLCARAARRFYWVVGAGVVATIEVGIVAFLLRAEGALQLPFGRLLYGDLSPIAGGTRFGTAFIVMTLGYALVAALLFLAWLTDRELLLWPAFLLALGFAAGLSLSGHSATDAGSSWKSELADWVHLGAASLWVGGLVQLALVVWPAAPELRRTAFLRFSRLATVLIAVVLSAGLYLSIVRLPEVSDLWTEGYGQVLMVKLGLVALALGWGALHHFVARPALELGSDGMLTRLSRSLVGESAVGMAVLLAAAILVNSAPPAKPAPQPPQAVSVQR